MTYTTIDQIQTDAQNLATAIFKHWNSLSNIIRRHESTIRTRWEKKTKTKREGILLTAWPNMPVSRRPDIQAFISNNRSKELYMWPQISVEDLSKSNLLLLLLNSRGRNEPMVFARADIDACRLGKASKTVVPLAAAFDGYMMIFADRHKPANYGEIVALNDPRHPYASSWLQDKRGYHLGEGLDVLRIQDRLYHFLLDCCKIILHDISTEQSTILIQPEPPLLLPHGSSKQYVSLAITTLEAPYRSPANIDFDRLEAFITAHFTAVEDHLWALREDPGYYADTVLDFKEHDPVLLLDTNGDNHPLLRKDREQLFWKRIIKTVCTDSLVDLEVWGSMHHQIGELRHMKEIYSDRIDPTKCLPSDYALAIYKLRFHLLTFSLRTIGHLKNSIPASPFLRRYWERLPPRNDATDEIIVQYKPGTKGDEILDTLQIWVLNLCNAEYVRKVGLDTIVEELGRLSDLDSKSRDCISSFVARKISELSIFAQCIHEIDCYFPWAATFENEIRQRQETLAEDCGKTEATINPYFECQYDGHITILGDPSGGRFKYPSHKNRSKIHVEEMRSAEDKLDEFWLAVDEELIGKNAYSTRCRQFFASRTLRRTTAWVEPSKTITRSPSTVDEPIFEPHFHYDPRSERGQPTNNAKPKTRGMARPTLPMENFAIPIIPELDTQPIFKVDRRALRVFKTIFFTPSASSQPGEIAWADFVHALCSIGFSAEKLYGSVWVFRGRGLDFETSIHFHEPHPSGKIAFKVARRHGRRLNRNYGWVGSMFVLK